MFIFKFMCWYAEAVKIGRKIGTSIKRVLTRDEQMRDCRINEDGRVVEHGEARKQMPKLLVWPEDANKFKISLRSAELSVREQQELIDTINQGNIMTGGRWRFEFVGLGRTPEDEFGELSTIVEESSILPDSAFSGLL